MVVSLIRWPKPKSDAPRRDRWGHRIGDPHHNFLRSRQWLTEDTEQDESF